MTNAITFFVIFLVSAVHHVIMQVNRLFGAAFCIFHHCLRNVLWGDTFQPDIGPTRTGEMTWKILIQMASPSAGSRGQGR